MNAKDRYNQIIDEIEKIIQKGDSSKPADIAEAVSRVAGQTLRELSSVFTFMTNRPLIQYIRNRQMMAAYRTLIESEDFDVNQAIAFTGLCDQSAFNKAFRGCFGITPGEAFRQKDKQIYEPALTWDMVSCSAAEIQDTEEDESMKAKTLFGVEMDELQKITEAMEYQTLYGFTSTQANAAFELAKKTQFPLKECFAFVDDFCIYFFADKDGKIVIEDEEEFRDFLFNSQDLMRLCIGFDISINEAFELMGEMERAGVSPSKVDLLTISIYMEGNLNFYQFWKAYNYGIDHGLKITDIPDYLEEVFQYDDLEVALEVYQGWKDFLNNL